MALVDSDVWRRACAVLLRLGYVKGLVLDLVQGSCGPHSAVEGSAGAHSVVGGSCGEPWARILVQALQPDASPTKGLVQHTADAAAPGSARRPGAGTRLVLHVEEADTTSPAPAAAVAGPDPVQQV